MSFWSVVALCALSAVSVAQGPSILPVPAKVQTQEGSVLVADGAVVSFPQNDKEAHFIADHLAQLVSHTRGPKLLAQETSQAPGALIVLERRALGPEEGKPEGYQLTITPRQIKITAPSDAGLYYGSVTLWQLLTATPEKGNSVKLACMTISDAPELAWRGIMLDSARHMQSVAYIKQLIERMSLEKLNVLHWHLTDDQGWRLEIKRYPRLTSVGGFRQLRATFPSQESREDEEKLHYGGFYTQAQVREIVAFAARRNVTIVPEIEMPGHASAALAAYPEFGSTSAHLKAPANEYGIFPYLYNVNDATFQFLENVLTEVMDLFPSQYIHVGGDEAIKDQWKASPTIQAQMKKLGIANEDELQSYFIKRIDTFLTKHHRRTIGWDEILEGGLAPNAAVMSWHGVEGGISAAKQGHDAVLTPVRPLYFNYRQTDAANESPGRFALNTLQDVYKFDPIPDTLTPQERKHIIGVQANLWTEYVITEDRVSWMLYPRAAALAEVGWSPASARNWEDFKRRLVVEMRRYDALGFTYDPDAFQVRTTEHLLAGQPAVSLTMANQAQAGTIHYTLDGSPATESSPVYSQPLHVTLPTRLRAATYLNGVVPGSNIDRNLNETSVRLRYSQDLKLCVNDPAIAMEQDPPNGRRAVMLVNYKHPCWIYQDAELTDVTGITVGVAALPYLFRDKNNTVPPLGSPKTAAGEVEVYLNTCSGKRIASIPLQPAFGHLGVTALTSDLPPIQGTHALCFKVARPTVTPLWALDFVQLKPAASESQRTDAKQ